jgi:integrase
MNFRIFTAALVMGFALASFGLFNGLRHEQDDGAATYGSSATMEAAVAVQKPKVVYAQFVAQHQPQTKQTISDIAGRFIAEMNGTDGRAPVKTLGESHQYTLERLQRSPIGAKVAEELTKADIIAHCRWRQSQGVLPQTVMGDITALTSALKYAGSAWDDCENVSEAAILAAKPFLLKHNLLAKSTPRTQRPTDEQKATLEELFARQNLRKRNKIDMVRVSRWQHVSTRRISESCRVHWRDWNWLEQTMLVRNMKDPKRRDKHKVVAMTWDAQALLETWAWEMNERPELRTDEPRILPFNSKSCSARYTMGKKEAGVVGIRLHDDRRDRSTKLVEVDGFSKEEAIVFTGHDSTQVFERTYLNINPSLMRFGPAAKRNAQEQA